jgi:hypothetical protein
MNEAKALTLEAGKYYRTRNGRKALAAAIMPKNPFKEGGEVGYPIRGYIDGFGAGSWTSNGHFGDDHYDDDRDLVAEWVEPKRIKGWVALQLHKERCVGGNRDASATAYVSHLYGSREEAAQMYAGDPSALVEIDVLEGHGLNGEAA